MKAAKALCLSAVSAVRQVPDADKRRKADHIVDTGLTMEAWQMTIGVTIGPNSSTFKDFVAFAAFHQCTLNTFSRAITFGRKVSQIQSLVKVQWKFDV